MPCNSDHMRSTTWERDLSRVCCLLDEVTTGTPVDPSSCRWDGYHPLAYCNNVSKSTADEWVSKLCNFCKTNDVTKYSLELQIWWRDHQKVDEIREGKEK